MREEITRYHCALTPLAALGPLLLTPPPPLTHTHTYPLIPSHPLPQVDRKFVFQGVHMLFQRNFTTKWKADEKRQNKFVFIGRDLPIERLETEFQGLYAKELRFPVGATVQANVGTFKTATVIKHWDDGNAYRLRLADGEEVWAPVDEDDFIKDARRVRGRQESV